MLRTSGEMAKREAGTFYASSSYTLEFLLQTPGFAIATDAIFTTRKL